MQSVVHLIPYRGIGGVERAAQSMLLEQHQTLSFSVTTIFPNRPYTSALALWNPYFYIRSVLLITASRPELLIVSLWRSCIVGIIVKLIHPRTKLVLFLHYPSHVHFFDRCLTTLAALSSTKVWADCHQTLLQRLPRLPSSKGRVISFVTEHISPAAPQNIVRPSFIFWGRLHEQKSIHRSIHLFSLLCRHYPNAHFTIIGPDSGELSVLKRQVSSLNLSRNVHFLGAMNFSSIRRHAINASFYLQTSRLEGMSMSVVEAMQLGLVPVVTPVGEIANYAHDGFNSVLVHDDAHTVATLISLLQDHIKYQYLRLNSVKTWSSCLLYRDDVILACKEILVGD